MKSNLRWGILSTARILRRFVPALRACPRSELVAVASRDGERAAACAARYQIPRHHGSYEALIDDPDIDAVYVALPNHLHATFSARCAEAGKHVLCEKPLGLAPAEVDLVAAAAARRGVHVVEAFVHLHHPQAARLRQELAAGTLGRLGLLRGSHGFSLRDGDNIRWRPEAGGGALWDVGCYPVSAFIDLVGRAPSEVLASAVLAPSGVDGALCGVLRFGEGGPLAHLDCSLVSPLRPQLEVAGELGSASLRTPFQPGLDGRESAILLQLHDGTPAPAQREIALPPDDPFTCEVRALEAAALDGAQPALPLAFSRAVAATLLALHESARSGRAVPL